MSTATFIAAHQVYGVQRACAAWGLPRATYYATAPRVLPPSDLPAGPAPAVSGKRGPKTTLDDAALLELIRADLLTSHFTGEGHRKVFGRLRYLAGHRVGRNRILRLIR
jgi:putative transposase